MRPESAPIRAKEARENAQRHAESAGSRSANAEQFRAKLRARSKSRKGHADRAKALQAEADSIREKRRGMQQNREDDRLRANCPPDIDTDDEETLQVWGAISADVKDMEVLQYMCGVPLALPWSALSVL